MTARTTDPASDAAMAQYQHAADQLRADGWDEFADEVYAFVARLERAALAEAQPWKPAR